MSHYGIILSQFWRGVTGRDIRTQGGKDAQLAALYLMSCENATMIGLYPLPVRVIKSDTGIGIKGLVRAFRVLGSVGYALYDARSEHVWVCEMAKFRLQLDRAPLKPADNRTLGAQRLYEKLIENPFLEPFFDRYAKDLHLKSKRRCGHRAEPLLDIPLVEGLPRPLPKGLKGLHKTVNRSEIRSEIRDQVQGSEIREQIRDQENLPPLSRRSVENLLKTQELEDVNAPAPTQTRGVATALRDRERPARMGARDRRRRVESADTRPLGPIGFHGSGSPDADTGDVGGGAGIRETARIASDARLEGAVDSSSGRPTEREGMPEVLGGPGSPRPGDGASNDRRIEPIASQRDARADSPVASGAGPGSASATVAVGEDTERLGETPGQAELRRTIERLRRAYPR